MPTVPISPDPSAHNSTAGEQKRLPAHRFHVRLRSTLAKLADTPAPLQAEPDVEFLRCSRALSGFRNVYASGPGWVAKVKEGGRLYLVPGSRQPTPQQSAAFVVAYYRERFGEAWRKALANRKRAYWRIGHSERLRGWIVTVWVNGTARTIQERSGGKVMARPLVFTEREEAVAFVQRRMFASDDRPAWRAA